MQLRCLVTAQPGRRLVHHDQPRVARQGSEDLDLLLLSHGHAANDPRGIDVKPDAVGQLTERVGHLPAANQASNARLNAEQHVLCGAEGRHQCDFLGNRRDSVVKRVARRSKLDRLAVDEDAARSRDE